MMLRWWSIVLLTLINIPNIQNSEHDEHDVTMVACGIALIRGEIDHPNKSSADPFDAAQIHHRLKPQHHFLQLTP